MRISFDDFQKAHGIVASTLLGIGPLKEYQVKWKGEEMKVREGAYIHASKRKT